MGEREEERERERERRGGERESASGREHDCFDDDKLRHLRRFLIV